MNIIYWTYTETSNGEVAVMSLQPFEDRCFCYTINEETCYTIFPTMEEAKQYVTEILKPKYYNNFRANYELKYLDVESEEWESVFEVWDNYYGKIKHEYLYSKLTWWRKIIVKLFKINLG